VNLYINCLAAPGEGKSPVVRQVTDPFEIIEQHRRDQLLPEIIEAEARKRVAEGRREAGGGHRRQGRPR